MLLRKLVGIGVLLMVACTGPTVREGCTHGDGSWRPGTLQIHHLDVGQADATLIIGPTGRTLLVDGGEARWDGSEGARAVATTIDRLCGDRHIDTVVLTHFHTDHTGFVGRGGVWRLINGEGFTIGRTLHRDLDALVGRSSATLDGWRGYLAGAGRAALSPRAVDVGDTVDLGPGVGVRVVAANGNGLLTAGDHSGDPAPPNEDDLSLALALRFGRLDYLLAGDLSGQYAPGSGYAYHDVERLVLPLVGDVDVLRVGHHGSAHSTGPAWLAQLAPEVAVISTGVDNSYGHPHPATVERLRGSGARLFMTSRGARAAPGGAVIPGPVLLSSRNGVDYTVAGEQFIATDPVRVDGDSDGVFVEADVDDADPQTGAAAFGGCDGIYERCP